MEHFNGQKHNFIFIPFVRVKTAKHLALCPTRLNDLFYMPCFRDSDHGMNGEVRNQSYLICPLSVFGVGFSDEIFRLKEQGD